MKMGLASLLLIAFLGTVACNPRGGFQATQVPTEKTKLHDIFSQPSEEFEPVEEAEENPELSEEEIPEEVKRETGLSLVEIGHWVIQNEAKKVGAACNFYIQRVFALMGFGKSSWLANNFDSFVEKRFSHYKKEVFKYDSRGAEQARLKKYLGALDEYEGVVVQWKRKVGPGHVAIVHRVKDQLVMYHASLNRFRPKAQTVEIKTLLHKPWVGYTLNVFSDFQDEASISP